MQLTIKVQYELRFSFSLSKGNYYHNCLKTNWLASSSQVQSSDSGLFLVTCLTSNKNCCSCCLIVFFFAAFGRVPKKNHNYSLALITNKSCFWTGQDRSSQSLSLSLCLSLSQKLATEPTPSWLRLCWLCSCLLFC